MSTITDERVDKMLGIMDTWMNGDTILRILDEQDFSIVEADENHIILESPDHARVELLPLDRWNYWDKDGQSVEGFGNWLELHQVLSPELRGF